MDPIAKKAIITELLKPCSCMLLNRMKELLRELEIEDCFEQLEKFHNDPLSPLFMHSIPIPSYVDLRRTPQEKKEEKKMILWQKCPVCEGTGLVSKPPGVAGDIQFWLSTSSSPYTCKRCDGTGTIKTPE